jgi:N,N'-diacetyllegionaminate synthase
MPIERKKLSDIWKRTACFIVGEVAQAHDGSLGMAHAYIDAIATAGADAVKFQIHIAAAESTAAEPWRVKFSPQDASRYDYWKRMEFSEDQWRGLKQHAEDQGLLFLCSPFSVDAVEMLSRLGVKAWKVASGEVSDTRLLERIMSTGLPILLSTGMSPLLEIDTIVEKIKARNIPIAILQCTTAYPCPPEKVGLNVISLFRERYNCPVGLSDHSGTIYPGLAAVALGSQILEVHVTLSREMFGPDVRASVTSAELRQLVDGVRSIELMLKHPVEKNVSADETASLRKIFSKSIVVRADLPAGTLLREEHLTLKKPGTGIPPGKFNEVVGRRLRRAVSADTILSEDDLER